MNESLDAIDTFIEQFYDIKEEQASLSLQTEQHADRCVEDYTGLRNQLTKLHDATENMDRKERIALGVGGAIAAGSTASHMYRKINLQ